jgi:hypothetical protein
VKNFNKFSKKKFQISIVSLLSPADYKNKSLENIIESSNSLAMKFIEDRQLAVRNRRLAQPRIILGDFSSNHLSELIVQNCKNFLSFNKSFLIRSAQKS